MYGQMIGTQSKSSILKQIILNDIEMEEGFQSYTSKIQMSEKDRKLDQVSLKIMALTFNMAGGLPTDLKEIDQIL